MKNKSFQFFLVALLAIPLIHFLFIDVPKGNAQSSQVWSTPINLSNSGSSTNPTLVIDSAGTIHVVWFDRFDGYKYTNSSDGVNWTAPKTVRFPFSPSTTRNVQLEAPALFSDKTGQIFAVWREWLDVETNVLYYSKVSVSLDRDLTSNWSNRIRLADSVADFDAFVSSQGILHVGYITTLGTDTDPAGVYYRQIGSSNNSSTFSLYPSQYFRSMQPESANIHLAVSETDERESVYVVWDDQSQHRIFMARSLDGGTFWESPVQIGEAGDDSSIPFNINVGALDNKVLLLWQFGLPGDQCTRYSQWSTGGGEQFATPVRMLGEAAYCYTSSDFLAMNKDFSIAAVNILEDISFLAWDGAGWSQPQVQNEIIAFENPATLDSVIFGCQQLFVQDKKLYVVGCDMGNGGDVWFTSRSLGSIEDWHPSSSVWSNPVEMTFLDQKISEFSSVTDGNSSIHTFMIQVPLLLEEGNIPNGSIRYVGWNNRNWARSAATLLELDGKPIHLGVKADHLNRLLLVWVNSDTGDILFSRAGTTRANLASEWETPHYVPSLSQANSSPYILVDGAGEILVAYAISINERRGIYFVASEDGGITWTQPFQIFDAASAGWDIVDQPNISLTGDGRLHALFRRYSLQGAHRQSLGLYYTHSDDGGVTWSDPEVVSEFPVQWSQIVGYDRSVTHRVWQEDRQSTFVSFHQVSSDDGITWSDPAILSSTGANSSQTALTLDPAGNLHFLQLTDQENLFVLEHKAWSGSGWITHEAKEIYIQNRGVPSSISADISADGNLHISILVNYPDLDDEVQSSLLRLEKSLKLPTEIEVPQSSILPRAQPTEIVTQDIELIPPTPVSTAMTSSDVPLFLSKNIVGFLLLGGLLVLIGFFFSLFFRKRNVSKTTSK